MKTCHNTNIIVKTKGGDAPSINGESEGLNKTLSNITRALILKSSHKNDLWCLSYQYTICISIQKKNRLRGDVTHLLCNVLRPSNKHMKTLEVRVYTINGTVKKKES